MYVITSNVEKYNHNKIYQHKLMCEIAAEHGGQCLSLKYLGNFIKLDFKCKNNHVFQMTPAHLKNGCWCRCATMGKVEHQQVIDAAKEMGGYCILPEKIRTNLMVECHCKNNHTFKTTIGSIIRNHWCPDCYINKDELYKAIEVYSQRDRRFGGVKQ